jgi:hypothetical protein
VPPAAAALGVGYSSITQVTRYPTVVNRSGTFSSFCISFFRWASEKTKYRLNASTMLPQARKFEKATAAVPT